MREILLFAEDTAHERVLTALTCRLAGEAGIPAVIRAASVVGGRGKLLKELRSFVREVRSDRRPIPDLLLVCTDANCKGEQWRDEIDGILRDYPGTFAAAIPDPHIEKWLLLDPAAFKQALGTGCRAPDAKCEKRRYKEWLARSVRDAGVTPEYGGLEYTADIVNAMDLDRLTTGPDRSLARLLGELRAVISRWTQVEQSPAQDRQNGSSAGAHQ